MKNLLALLYLLTLLMSGCATAHEPHDIPAQVQRRHYSRATLHYHHLHGQTLRHPNGLR